MVGVSPCAREFAWPMQSYFTLSKDAHEQRLHIL